MIQHNQYLRSELTSCVIIFYRAHEGERSGEKIRGHIEIREDSGITVTDRADV